MIKTLVKIVNNRNFLLISALVLGLTFTHAKDLLKPFILPTLSVTMIFSSTGFRFKVLKDWRLSLKVTLIGFLLNFVIFGTILLLSSYLLISDKAFLYGLIVIAATPPGVAIVPFTTIYKGDINRATVAVLGLYILSIFLTPFIIKIFAAGSSLSPWGIVKIMFEIVLIPILLSRLLLVKPIKPTVEKIRGKVVNWGFAIIIYTIIALNRDTIFHNFGIVLKLAVIFAITMFGAGIVYEFIFRKKSRYEVRLTNNLLLTIKSSGFAAGTALSLFGGHAALPSAVLAIFVISYLIFVGFLVKPDKNSQQFD